MFAPTTFGKYFLTEHLATGGMAEIYRGKLLGPGGFEKQLVIKQIHPRFGQRREFVDLFVAEAKTTVSLSHGNIVPIFELGVVDGTYFIAMEYVDGPTLTELTRQLRARGRRLEPGVAATIAAEILKGLDYAHRKGGVIHRDLSPRNVLVSRDGEVKILDFGLAATFENAAEASKITSAGGRPVGSFPYMSPEQAARAPLDARSDLFSAGILLWELLTGETLFGRGDDDATLEAVRAAPIPAPSTRSPAVPPALDAVCLRALERDAAARWPSAAEFLATLGRYLYTVDPPVTPVVISTMINEVCPDVPQGTAPPTGAGSEAPGETTPHADSGTMPMLRTPVDQRSFATHVELERALERNRTPLMPFPALEADGLRALSSAPGVTPEPPAARPSLATRPAPRPAPPAATVDRTAPVPRAPTPRRSRALPIAVVVVALAGGGFLATRALRPDRRATASRADAGTPALDIPDAGHVVAKTAADAAPSATAAPDAAAVEPVKRPFRADAGPPAATGRLVVSAPEVAWARVELDGKHVGETPIPAPGLEVAAGRHTIVIICAPEVCAPDGRRVERTVTVPSGGVHDETVRF